MYNVAWPGWKTGERIKHDGFGDVYEIQRISLGKQEKAALKVITIPHNPRDIEDMLSEGYDKESIADTFKGYVDNIVAEYSRVQKLNDCINVVNCDEVKTVRHSDGIGWDILVKMELLSPLTRVLPAKIPENTVIEVANAICYALSEAQSYGILHQDIKPQNIYWADNGVYKLGNIGVGDAFEKTVRDVRLGSQLFMAPEVYHNQPASRQSDIYSLGLVLYWMLNERRLPFQPLPPAPMNEEIRKMATRRRLSGEALPSPANGSDLLKRIVMKACAWDAAERYQTAQQMLLDLELLDPEPTIGVFTVGSGQSTVPAGVNIPRQTPNNTCGNDERGRQIPAEDPGKETRTPADTMAQTDTKTKGKKKKKNKQGKKKKGLLAWLLAGLAVVAIVILLFLRGCEGSLEAIPGKPQATQPSAAAEQYEMVLSQEQLSVVVNTAVPLHVTGIPQDAQILWQSGNTKVATVDENGNVTGISDGKTTITASWTEDGVTYSASATVRVESSGVILSAYDLLLVEAGETAQLSAVTFPEGKTVTWSTTDPSVVTVSEDGLVTAVAEGTASVTAQFGNATAVCSVFVVRPELKLDQKEASLYKGDELPLTVSASPADTKLTWISQDGAVATVINGTVKATGVGQTQILVTMKLGKETYEDSCAVQVKTPTVTVSSEKLSLMPGGSEKLTATTDPGDCEVTWSSSDTNVATVAEGTVKAVGSGTAEVTARITYGEETYSAVCAVTVQEPKISVTSSANTITYSEINNQTCTLTATVNPDGGQISWKSSDSGVAKVSGSGTKATVTAVAEGTATITATYTVSGKTLQDACQISVRKAASTLNVKDLSCPAEGRVEDFKISGTLSSNYAITKALCDGVAKPTALGFVNYDIDAEPFWFPENTYTADMGMLTRYFIEQYRDVYEFYAGLAGFVGADNSVKVNVTGTIFDTSGKQLSFSFTYVIRT